MEAMMLLDIALSVVEVGLLAYMLRMLNKASRVAGDEPKEVEPVISEDRFYTLAQVADLLGLHPMTIRRHIKSGKLSAYRVGLDGRYRVAGEDLRIFVGARDAGVRLPK